VRGFSLFLHVYPFIAISAAVVFLELGIYLKRKQRMRRYYMCLAAAGFLAVTGGIWFFFRGDLNAQNWVKTLFFIE
jgi:hypothetical protein